MGKNLLVPCTDLDEASLPEETEVGETVEVDEGKEREQGETSLLSICNVPTCWTVGLVAFNKDPGALSFACRGCAAPGVVFNHYNTTLADGSDRNVMARCLDMPYTFCSGTFLIPLHLHNKGWGPVFEDSIHLVYASIKSAKTAVHLINGCPCICNPDGSQTEMNMPATFGDPGGPSRCMAGHPECTQCDLSYCVTAGGSSHLGHQVPEQPGSGPEGCIAVTGCPG